MGKIIYRTQVLILGLQKIYDGLILIEPCIFAAFKDHYKVDIKMKKFLKEQYNPLKLPTIVLVLIVVLVVLFFVYARE